MLFWLGKMETQWQNCPKALNEAELDALCSLDYLIYLFNMWATIPSDSNDKHFCLGSKLRCFGTRQRRDKIS
jgi:hypothetical protein